MLALRRLGGLQESAAYCAHETFNIMVFSDMIAGQYSCYMVAANHALRITRACPVYCFH